MKLFEIVEKSLPDMRRHLHALAKKDPKEKRLSDEWKLPVGNEMLEWLWDEYLHEHSMIYQTFLKAGVHRKFDMACWLLIWTIWEDNLQQAEQISRAGTSPAQE